MYMSVAYFNTTRPKHVLNTVSFFFYVVMMVNLCNVIVQQIETRFTNSTKPFHRAMCAIQLLILIGLRSHFSDHACCMLSHGIDRSGLVFVWIPRPVHILHRTDWDSIP